MAEKIKATVRCSECMTVRDTALNSEDKDLVCPACGRRLQNLTGEEFSEMGELQKKQKLFQILAVIFFALSAGCVLMWMGEPKGWSSAAPERDGKTMFFAIAIVFGLLSMVLGSLGSRKRLVVEF